MKFTGATMLLLCLAMASQATANNPRKKRGFFDIVDRFKDFFDGAVTVPPTETGVRTDIRLTDAQCEAALTQCSLVDVREVVYRPTYGSSVDVPQLVTIEVNKVHAHYRRILTQMKYALVTFMDLAMNNRDMRSVPPLCSLLDLDGMVGDDGRDGYDGGSDDQGNQNEGSNSGPTDRRDHTDAPTSTGSDGTGINGGNDNTVMLERCTYSSWSDWSVVSGGREVRMRVILRPGVYCPEKNHLVEVRLIPQTGDQNEGTNSGPTHHSDHTDAPTSTGNNGGNDNTVTQQRCTYSSWSDWTIASANTEKRVRVILRPGVYCPEENHLVEVRLILQTGNQNEGTNSGPTHHSDHTDAPTSTGSDGSSNNGGDGSTVILQRCTCSSWSDWSIVNATTQRRERVILKPGVECPEENHLVEVRLIPQADDHTVLAERCSCSNWTDWFFVSIAAQMRVRKIVVPGRQCPEASHLNEYRNVASADMMDSTQYVKYVSENFLTDFIRMSEARPRDLLLVLDSSASIDDEQFQVMKNGISVLINSLCGGFGRAPNQNRLSIVQFSTNSKFQWFFSQAQDKTALKQLVNSLQPMRGHTCTAHALNMSVDAFSARNGHRENSVPDTLIITDGQSNCNGDIAAASRELQRKSNVYALAIGVSAQVSAIQEIHSLVSSRNPRHLFSLANFGEFSAMADTVKSDQASGHCQPIIIN